MPTLTRPSSSTPGPGRFIGALAVLGLLVSSSHQLHAGPPLESSGLPLERQDDAPAFNLVNAVTPAATISFGRFTSIQVNVSASGQNILNDAANEPSIAVDPNDPSKIAIGWRQFDSIASNFRQAGYGYSTDGGMSWTTGKIEPGVFRSDPVLGFDTQGKFFYNSLMSNLTTQVFPSTNDGASWGSSVSATTSRPRCCAPAYAPPSQAQGSASTTTRTRAAGWERRTSAGRL